MIKDIVRSDTDRRTFFLHLSFRCIRVLSGISLRIAVLTRPASGTVASRFRKNALYVMKSANPIYMISSTALFGFLILLSGIGNKTVLTTPISYVLLPMSGYTYIGITGTDPEFSEARKSRGNVPVRILRKIKFPNVRPIIPSGLRYRSVLTTVQSVIAAFSDADSADISADQSSPTGSKTKTVTGSGYIAVQSLPTSSQTV